MSKKSTEENLTVDSNIFVDSSVDFNIPSVETIEKPTPKLKQDIKSCKVISRVGKDKAIVDFDGFGLLVAFDKKDCKSVDVKYSGKIGTPDFRYEVK